MEGVSSIPPTQQKPNFEGSVKAKARNYERQAGLSHIEKRIIANRPSNDPKTLQSIHQRLVVSKGVDSDEHCQYMSNPAIRPAHSNKGGSLQDKALKVGVLNLDRVDKWKHNQVGVLGTRGHVSSSASSHSWTSLGSKLYYESHSPPTKQRASITSTVGYVPGEPNKERIICLLSPQKPISSGQQQMLNMERSSSGNYSYLRPARKEAKEISGSRMQDDTLYINSKPAGVYETKKVLDLLDRPRTKNHTQTELYSEIQRTISSMRSGKSPSMPKISTIADDKMENKIEKQLSSDTKLNYHVCPPKKENVIVLVNKDTPSAPGDCLLPESQASMVDVLESNWCRTSDVFSEQDSLSTHVSAFSLSSSLPPYPDCDGDSANNIKTDRDEKDVHNVMVQPKVYGRFSNGESSDLICVPGQAAKNSRSQSPLRYLSNGFSRMRKSPSFKDDSVPLSNSKRFPTSVGVHSSQVVLIKEKSEAPKKARSSPLRRLIDPILKPKVPISSPYVDDHTQSAVGYKISDKASDKASRLSQMERKTIDTVQALLQCSTKNGIPVFKFISKKKGDALVATLADTSEREKSNLRLNFNLYSVNEMTKNSSWKYQGRTSKNTGYLYSVVGQIRLCISSTDETTGYFSSSKRFTGVESTLFGVQPCKTDQEKMKVRSSGELAALIMTPNDNFGIRENGYTMEKFLKELGECFSKEGLSNMTGCCKRSNTTVILPAGVHTIPNKGAPSPLIHRWRSGGSCDCGGWDIGCSMSLLHNEKDEGSCKPAEQRECSSASECFQLFSQSGAYEKGPLFRLTPFNEGIYAVDFKPSAMSDLQAFFTSLAVLISQITSDLSKGTE